MRAKLLAELEARIEASRPVKRQPLTDDEVEVGMTVGLYVPAANGSRQLVPGLVTDRARRDSGRITYTVRRTDKEVTQGPGGRHGLEREASDLYPLEVPAAGRVVRLASSTRRRQG